MDDSRRDLQDSNLNSLVPDVQVNRRGFVAACLAAGFAVTAEPLLAQAIKTSMDGLEGGDSKIGDIPIYYAVPKGKGKRPVVLVVGEVWGNHEHIKDVVRRVAKAGYFAVANEPYFRIGELWKMTDIKEVLAGANKLTDEQAFADLDAVVGWADKNARANTKKLGITGFCRGGRMVWMYTAHNKKVDAGVAWYGGLQPGAAGAAAHADRRRGQDRPAGARPLRRRRPGHPARARRDAARRPQGIRQRQEIADPRLRRHAARLQRRLPSELSQGSCRRRMEANAGLVQKEWSCINKKGRPRRPSYLQFKNQSAY